LLSVRKFAEPRRENCGSRRLRSLFRSGFEGLVFFFGGWHFIFNLLQFLIVIRRQAEILENAFVEIGILPAFSGLGAVWREFGN